MTKCPQLRFLALLFVALFVHAGLAAAQTFQTGSRLVLVDVIVRNDDGPIRGLTKDDFIVKDKGKKQEIQVFEITEAGKSDTAPIPITPMIASNRFNSNGEFQRTASILLYDRVNTVATDQSFVRQQVLRMLASLKDTDRVGFYSLGFQLQMVRDYDEDAAPLARIAQRLLEENSSMEGLSPADQALYKSLSEALQPMQELANQAKVNITYPAFRAIAHRLTGVPGRKNLLWVTSTFPLTFGNAPERRRNDEMELNSFEQNLLEANIAVYPVDPGGTGAAMQTPNEVSTEASILASRGSPVVRTNIASSLTSNQTMMRLANSTGGKAYRNMNDIEPALREVADSAEYTYTIGFIPEEKTLDERRHKLEVELVKKPETNKAKVSHRKEYMAWGPKSSPDLQQRPNMRELLQQTTDASGVNLLGVANLDPAKPNTFQMDVRIGVENLLLSPVGDKYVGAFDMVVSLEGQEEKAAMLETFPIEWTQDQYRQALASGLVVAKPMTTDAASGRFHVIVQDKASGLAGSLRIPFAKPQGQ